MPITVSVVCPVRNEERYIEACLTSLTTQTYDSARTEILVVDGMSDDATREIVRTFERQHSNVRLVDNPERIVAAGLNRGVRESRGRYILRMDGHAKAAPDYVAECVRALEENDVACVGGPIITSDSTSTGKAISLAMSSSFGVGNSRFRTSVDKECFVDTLAFPAFPREVFDRHGLFDPELVRCQDDEFNFRLRKAGGKILLTPKIHSWYYPRAQFAKLWRQYFGYGYFKVRVLQKHFWMMQPRHFVPAAFVALLIGLLVLSFVSGLSLAALLAIVGLYAGTSLVAAVAAKRRAPEVALVKVLLSFYILHFAYGTGFLWGLVRFAPRWFRREVRP